MPPLQHVHAAPPLRFLHVELHAAVRSLSALSAFYGGRLGLETLEQTDDHLVVRVGESRLELAAGAGEPFYHFALLAPGNRFDAALAWARDRTDLLPYSKTGEVIFDFDNWDALAGYFHDPAGNIVEVIAHGGVDETSSGGDFEGPELVGVSELGLVGDVHGMAAELERRLGLELWDGTLKEEGRLAFVGERARTLILSPEGRGWFPTGRPAEAHPCAVTLSGPPEGEAVLADSLYRIRRTSPRA